MRNLGSTAHSRAPESSPWVSMNRRIMWSSAHLLVGTMTMSARYVLALLIFFFTSCSPFCYHVGNKFFSLLTVIPRARWTRVALRNLCLLRLGPGAAM